MKRILRYCSLCMIIALAFSALPVFATTPGPGTSSVAESSDGSKATEAPVEIFDPNVTLSVRYDYDGKVRPGYTIPAFIEIENKGGEIDGELRLSVTPERSNKSVLYTLSVHVDENGTASYVLPFQAISTRNVQLYLYQNKRVVAKAPFPKLGVSLAATSLVGVFSDNGQDMAYWQSLKELRDRNGEAGAVSVVELTGADFPDKSYLMDRFSVIVLNHYDIGLLSRAQQTVLTEWVTGGGTLLTDADPANGPALQSLSPLLGPVTLGEAAPEGITQELFRLANTAYTNQQEIGSLGVLSPEGNVLYALQDQPLLMEYEADKGKVFVTTFALSSPALSHSGVVAGLFGKIPGMSSVGAYEIEGKIYGGRGSLSDAVRSASWLDAVSIDWVLILIIVFIILAGPVNYAVLAAKDKRDWIWVTAPALAVVFCVIIIGAGTYQHGGDVISSVVSVVDNRGSGSASSYSEVGIGVPGSGKYNVKVAQSGLPGKYLYSDYYYDDENAPDITKVGEPSIHFDLSGQTGVTFPSIARWDMDSFQMERDLELSGKLLCEVETDGKTTWYQIKNETDYPLEDVTVVTPGGYIRVPLMEAGEELAGELEEYSSTLYGNQMSYGGQMDYWLILSELYGGEEYVNYYYSGYGYASAPPDDRSEEQKRDDYVKYTMINSVLNNNYYGMSYNGSGTSGQYTIWAWSRTLGALDIQADGKPVRSEQNLTLLLDDITLHYATDKGLYIPAGVIAGKASDISGIIMGSAQIGGVEGWLQEGEIIYDFVLPEVTMDYALTSFTVYAQYNSGAYSLYLKNHVTQQWNEIYLDKAFSPEDLLEYVDEDRTVQLSIQRNADGSEANFSLLSLAVEGTVK